MASQIRLDSAYVQVIVALVVYVAGSAALGGVLALRAPAGQATAILLPVAMRDFAVAAGIAAAAFGPAAAAPLGAYGVLVLLAGSLAAIIARRRPAPRPRPDASIEQSAGSMPLRQNALDPGFHCVPVRWHPTALAPVVTRAAAHPFGTRSGVRGGLLRPAAIGRDPGRPAGR